MNITYYTVDHFPGLKRTRARITSIIEEHKLRRICEIGAGANPTLHAEDIAASALDYTANDVCAEELDKAPAGFHRLLLDFTGPDVQATAIPPFDLIFSRMVNEHVSDGERYYCNIHSLLRPGGLTAHWFATLYALPFVVNWLLPESVSDRLLDTMAPRDRHRQGKFKAHYAWSRGPTRKMIRRFESLGFEVVTYEGYFGHRYYAKRLPWLDRLEQRKSRWLARHPWPRLTSYAFILLRKPGQPRSLAQSDAGNPGIH